MKNRIDYQLFAQRLFQVLSIVSFIGLLASIVMTGLINFHPAFSFRRELMPEVAEWTIVVSEVIPLLHYLFFTLFFYQLGRLFQGFNAERSFSHHAVRSSGLLGVGCLLYAALNLIEMGLVSLIGLQVIGDYFMNTLLISAFVGVLALVFFLQHQAFQEALRLQAENKLTI